MSGRYLIGLNKQVRAGAGVAPGDRVSVEIVLDDEERAVEVPEDLGAALDSDARAFFDSLSYTNRKEYARWIEEAKRAETRQARVAKAVTMLGKRVRHP